MDKTPLESYYVVESGKYVLYEFNVGNPKKVCISNRLAISYDSRSLEFRLMGEPSYVMMWAAMERTRLRANDQPKDAECLFVAFLPPGHEVRELNMLMKEPSYITTFLQKAGLI